MKYFSKQKMNVMRLSRGFVFRADFLRNAQILLSSTVEEFCEEDFLIVNNSKKLSYAFKIYRLHHIIACAKIYAVLCNLVLLKC